MTSTLPSQVSFFISVCLYHRFVCFCVCVSICVSECVRLTPWRRAAIAKSTIIKRRHKVKISPQECKVSGINVKTGTSRITDPIRPTKWGDLRWRPIVMAGCYSWTFGQHVDTADQEWYQNCVDKCKMLWIKSRRTNHCCLHD